MKINILFFEQPIGEFAIGVMSAKDILKISRIDRLEFDQVSMDTKGGPQREPSNKRISEIAEYATTSDATFPTPILIALDDETYTIEEGALIIQDKPRIASIVDGQHRIMGIEKSGLSSDYSLPVVFILGANDEEKALIFAIINGKQTRVSASVIYELYKVVEGRNPFKTAHEIARALNSNPESPYFRRLKMLGKKITDSNETLSQGTFVTQLLKNITTDPGEDFNLARSGRPFPIRSGCVFNEYFLNEKDDVILKLLMNIYGAVKFVFPEEWENGKLYILSKTTGYTGIMKAMPDLIAYGRATKSMTFDTYVGLFMSVKKAMIERNLSFTIQSFSANNTGESKLRDFLKEIILETQNLTSSST